MSRPTRHEVRVGLKLAIGVLLAVVVPGMACYGYYAVTGLSPERAGWAPAVALAMPVALVSAIGLGAAMLAAIPRPRRVRACAAVLLVSASLVLVAETHAFGF
jgi:hypothetical protein